VAGLHGLFAATAPDTTDHVLVAYELSAAQSAQFDAFDGQMSPFWEEWEAGDPGASSLDYVHMTSADSQYIWNRSTNGFDASADDAQVTVRAAYDSAGAYYWLAVVDNSWVEAGDAGHDVVIVYIENESLEEWYFAAGNAAFECAEMFPHLDCNLDDIFGWGPSFTYRLIEVAVGGASSPTGFEFNYYDDETWTILEENFVSFAEADSLYDGLAVEVVLGGIPGERRQEWFIPWSVYGVGGIPGGSPEVGATLALSLGYNDSDADQPSENDYLRWKKEAHPFFYWRNIETYGGDLEISGISFGETSVRMPRSVTAHRAPRQIVGTEYFTLKGERLPGYNRYRTGVAGVLIMREAGTGREMTVRRAVVR
jgi:hypothetical protein